MPKVKKFAFQFAQGILAGSIMLCPLALWAFDINVRTIGA